MEDTGFVITSSRGIAIGYCDGTYDEAVAMRDAICGNSVIPSGDYEEPDDPEKLAKEVAATIQEDEWDFELIGHFLELAGVDDWQEEDRIYRTPQEEDANLLTLISKAAEILGVVVPIF